MDYEFEEDPESCWLVKQREDALLAKQACNKNEKIVYKEGDQVGNFLFIHYNKFKNRVTFKCQECGRKFTYNIYTIKNKKDVNGINTMIKQQDNSKYTHKKDYKCP